VVLRGTKLYTFLLFIQSFYVNRSGVYIITPTPSPPFLSELKEEKKKEVYPENGKNKRKISLNFLVQN